MRLTEEDLIDHYEQAPCGYCTGLPDGTLVRLNSTLLGWLGYAREELVARATVQQLLTVGGRLHYEMHALPLLLLQGEVRELSYRLRHKDGSTRPVLLNARLLRDPDGQPLVVRLTFFDITERHRYEQELRRTYALAQEHSAQLAQANALLLHQNEQLTRSTADLDNFVYLASHDLRQPINNMAGLFAELKRTAAFTDPEQERMVHMFEAALQQAVHTIDGLAEVVKQQRDQALLPVEALALHPLAEEIIGGLQPQVLAQQAVFTLNFEAAPTVHTIRPGLYSVLYNLFSNALKYAEPGRPVRVVAHSARVAGAVVLTVQDNGRGLDLAQHGGQLFQLFSRFHPEVEGTGTGLYLVNRLMTQAGGRVEVASEVGQGTTFRLVWPQ
jgi:sigma-B regulation protein RsbU (phosphoserine phosphatase)